MNKKEFFEKAKTAISLFFRIRRGYKIYLSFATGILSGFAFYKDVYDVYHDKSYALILAILGGVFITVCMLLFIAAMGIIIGKLKETGLILFSKYKERNKKLEEPEEEKDS